MSRSNRGGGDQGDVAALAATIIAIVITNLFGKGSYDLTGLIVGLTLALLVAGYVWSHPRTILQSLAVCSVVGGLAVPVAGYFIDTACAGVHRSFPDLSLPILICADPASNEDSYVYDAWAFGIWLVVAAATFALDRRQQKTS